MLVLLIFPSHDNLPGCGKDDNRRCLTPKSVQKCAQNSNPMLGLLCGEMFESYRRPLKVGIKGCKLAEKMSVGILSSNEKLECQTRDFIG